MKLASTHLAGPGSADTLGAALASIAPHVDLCIVIDTLPPEDDAGHVALLAACRFEPKHHVVRRPWCDDFGEARNWALHFAAMAGATWAITLDSDEWIEGGEELGPFLAALPDATRAAMMAHASGTYYQPRAIRLPCSARWFGRVHEAIDVTGPRFERARFCDRPKTPEQMRAKRLRDFEACLRMIDDAPKDPRWWYYAGDALAGLGATTPPEDIRTKNMQHAVMLFTECATLPGWDEQAAWAAYRAAEIMTQHLGQHAEAVEMVARGLARHAGIAELAWLAALASFRLGRHEQAIHWSRLADVHGVPGLGGDGRALRSRTLFREPKGLTFGPAEVRQHAFLAVGDLERAAEANGQRIRRTPDEALCGVLEEALFAGSGPVCTEPRGHEGDHIADDPETGREVSRWANAGPRV
jgi:hypothetical protein